MSKGAWNMLTLWNVLETVTQGICHSVKHIPLLTTLTKLSKHRDILADVMQCHSSSDGKLRDYYAGSFYKSNNSLNMRNHRFRFSFTLMSLPQQIPWEIKQGNTS